MYLSILAVGIGGALGSLFRWFLGIRLNGVFPALPLGTLAANIIAGYVIGVAVAFFARLPELAPEWRLFVITGCMGGLTTFSSFSAEAVSMMSSGQYGGALLHTSVHLFGSFALTALGILSYRVIAG